MGYLDDIGRLADLVPYGEINFSVKRHNGKTTSVISQTFESKKYNYTADAAAAILQMIKNAEVDGLSGEITFVVVLDKGKLKRVIQHGHELIRYIDDTAK